MPCIADPNLALFVAPPNLRETETCAITDFVTQGNYPICWVACIATIANYRNGDDLTAGEVATAAGHIYYSSSYNSANLSEIVSALSLYGLDYSCVYTKLTWSSLKNNINADRPFIIIIESSAGRHALTCYGYSCQIGDADEYSSSRYVSVWDPNGSETTFQYNATNLKFSRYSYTWTWEATIYD